MQKIQPVITHLERVYGMEVVPCSIPKNNFQFLKRNFYLFIKKKMGDNIFYFLRDKVSPIKYLNDRPEGEIWLRKRNESGRIEFELELKPMPIEACIYSSGSKNHLLDLSKGDNYRVRVYHQMNEIQTIEFIVNYHNGCEIVDYGLSAIPFFKKFLRDYKLEKLFMYC